MSQLLPLEQAIQALRRHPTHPVRVKVDEGERLELPSHLRGVFFDWIWQTTKVWSLPTPTSHLRLRDLNWHLDLTVWTTVRGEPRFDLAPKTVIANPVRFAQHWRKVQEANLAYPLELFRNGDRWVILDGYHRLTRHSIQRSDQVPVRLHPDEYRELIRPESGP